MGRSTQPVVFCLLRLSGTSQNSTQAALQRSSPLVGSFARVDRKILTQVSPTKSELGARFAVLTASRRCEFGNQTDVLARRPAYRLPEGDAIVVGVVNEQVAFLDTRFGQARHAAVG